MAKVGRPKGSKSKKGKVGKGCHKIKIYHKVKGVVRPVKGYTKKSCLKRKSKKK